jgi:hypothetical protein
MLTGIIAGRVGPSGEVTVRSCVDEVTMRKRASNPSL